MSYRPFRPSEKHFAPPLFAIVATPAIVQENQAQLVATELRQSATVIAEKTKPPESVANHRRTVAEKNTHKIDTVATIATVADQAAESAVSHHALFFLDRAIPADMAHGLAWLLDSLPFNPQLSPTQREQATVTLHWLAEEEYRQRCYILFG